MFIYTTCVYMYVVCPLTPFNMVFTHEERCTNSSSTVSLSTSNLGGWPQVADCFLRQNSGENSHPTPLPIHNEGKIPKFPPRIYRGKYLPCG